MTIAQNSLKERTSIPYELDLLTQTVKNLPAMWETLSVGDLGWEDLLEKEMANHSSILA